jgi:RNA polymerase sigma factor (sigma-70 family)
MLCDPDEIAAAGILNVMAYYRGGGRLPAGPGLSAFMNRVTRNAGIAEHRRATAAKRAHGRVDVDPFEIPDQRDVEQAVESDEGAALVRKAIASLNAKDAELLGRRYFDGQPVNEIARQIGVTEKAMGVRLLRARARLKDALEKLGVGVPDQGSFSRSKV